MPRGDWTPTKIILALQAKGLTINELIQRENINANNFPQLEQAISKALNVPLKELWPRWYNPD